MALGAGQQYWDEHARTDPMWAILTDPTKSGGRWDAEEFFATGVREIDHVLEQLGHWGLPAARRNALDFGCGLGRLTQPLADHFERTYGVDISPAMLKQAREFNRKKDRCEYVWNQGTRLPMFADGSIDFIYSKITLQHIPPRHVRSYLKDFMRILAPGGLLWFQLPSVALCRDPGLVGQLKFGLTRLLSRAQVRKAMYMNGIPREKVIALLEGRGGRIVNVHENHDAGVEYQSFSYIVTK